MTGLPDFIPQTVPAVSALAQSIAPFDPQLPAPYRFDDVGTRLFPLPADRDQLQQVCDHFINNIAITNNLPFRINPIQSLVLMEILSYPKMYSAGPGHDKYGYSTQNEFLFAIPVALWNQSPIPYPTAVGLFIPFLFVDNDWSMIAGRDIAGFPKVQGHFDVPQSIGSVYPTKIEARVLDPFNPNTESKFDPVLEIAAKTQARAAIARPANPFGDLEPRQAWPYGPLNTLYGEDADRHDLTPVSQQIYDLLLESAGVQTANYSLKQFRNGQDPGKADYQSILESRMTLSNFGQPGAYANTKIQLHGYDSLKIADTLGLQLNAGVLDPFMQLRFQASFEFEIIRNLYARCGDSVESGRSRSCRTLFKDGAKAAAMLIKGQLAVTKNVGKNLAEQRFHPRYYANDLAQAGNNAIRYGTRVSELTLEGMSHLFRR